MGKSVSALYFERGLHIRTSLRLIVSIRHIQISKFAKQQQHLCQTACRAVVD